MIKEVTSEKELEAFVSGGTFTTGRFALKQGKRVFVMTPEGDFRKDVETILKSVGRGKE